jgi:hypothetical protein
MLAVATDGYGESGEATVYIIGGAVILGILFGGIIGSR